MSHKSRPYLRPMAGLAAAAIMLAVTACGTEPETAPESRPSATASTSPSGTASPSEGASESGNAEPSSAPKAIGQQEIVENDGHDLAFYITAGTKGTIVLDAGGGNDAAYWNDLVPELAEATGAAIVTYDRTGAGQSDDVPGAWDPAQAGDDLATGIQTLDLPDGPVLLASHSIAGEVATALVNAQPGLVDGAVTIDANLPPFFTPEEVKRLAAANEEGITELKAAPQSRQTRQLLSVAENFGPVHTAFHTATWPENIPVTVIVAEDTPMPPGSKDAQNWRDGAQAFADQASNRHLVTAVGSSHEVALDDPALVQREIATLFASL